MSLFACQRCGNAWQVGGDPEEIRHILSMVHCPPCITPLCLGRLEKVPSVPFGYRSQEVPIANFYRAVNGFGSPSGESATVGEFSRLIRTKKVVEVKAEPVGQPERVILRRLVLDDGTRLHFESSSRGACCYYIEKPGPTCLEVVDEIHSDGAPESSSEDREEVGRVAEALAELSNGPRETAASAQPHDQPESIPLPPVPKTGEVPSGGGARRVSVDD